LSTRDMSNQEASQGLVVVVGLGEVGMPLLNILSRIHDCVGVDLNPVEIDRPCSVLHLCYPFQIRNFIGISADYVAKYQPQLTMIHSTVAPGTTRELQQATATDRIVFSPIRGKHARMESDMLHYKKFVAASSPEIAQEAASHFAQAGFKTDIFPTPEIGELSKLVETTYLGILVGWAQEIERFANRYGGSAEDVNAFIEEIDYLPHHIFPGHIGGHCVMPNIEILRNHLNSRFLDAVVESNELKRKQLGSNTNWKQTNSVPAEAGLLQGEARATKYATGN
jgi:UDP-N-acetyl-D-mannosaminuronate dehydrogenase